MRICLSEDRRARYMLFVFLALAINLVDSAAIRSAAYSSHRMMVTAAAWCDIVLVVAGLYYWLLIRPGIRARWTILPIALAGVVRLSASGPIMAAVGELALVALFPGTGRILATEFRLIYYALFSWRVQPDIPADATAFTIYKKSMQRDLFYAAALLSVIEIIPAHILLHLWSPVAAWIATALSFYAAIWLVGLARSIELRPSLSGSDYLDIRYGVLFHLRIPREKIELIRRAEPTDPATATVLPSRSDPTVCIELTEPLEAEKLFGIRRPVTRLALAADEDFDHTYQILTKLY